MIYDHKADAVLDNSMPTARRHACRTCDETLHLQRDGRWADFGERL